MLEREMKKILLKLADRYCYMSISTWFNVVLIYSYGLYQQHKNSIVQEKPIKLEKIAKYFVYYSISSKCIENSA